MGETDRHEMSTGPVQRWTRAGQGIVCVLAGEGWGNWMEVVGWPTGLRRTNCSELQRYLNRVCGKLHLTEIEVWQGFQACFKVQR